MSRPNPPTLYLQWPVPGKDVRLELSEEDNTEDTEELAGPFFFPNPRNFLSLLDDSFASSSAPILTEDFNFVN